MDKAKRVWNENKVLLVLAIILVVCIVIIILVSLRSFYGTSNSAYGKRLDTIKDNKLDSKLFESIKSTLNSKEDIESTNVILKGKIVYINVLSKEDAKIDTLKEEVKEVLALFKEEDLKLYDIEFQIGNKTKDESKLFSIMGARNKSGKGEIVWGNRNMENIKKDKEESAE